MAVVLFASSRHPGYVLPLLRLARSMTRRGDRVLFLTGQEFQPRVEDAGAEFVRLPYDAARSGARPADAAALTGRRQIDHLMRTVFLDPVEDDFRTVDRLVEAHGVDLVVAEPLFVGATLHGLRPRAERPGILSVNLSPLPLSGAEVAPYGSGLPPMDGPLNAARNTALGVAADLLYSGGVRRAFAAEVRRLTGHRVTGPVFDLALTADVFAQTTVPQFEYPRRRLSPKVRYVGPISLEQEFALPDWWDYSERRPIVHVTQGTYANQDPTELIVPTIRALAGEEVLVVATTGGPDPEAVAAAHGGPLPANARVERFMPYDHLLSEAAVMVTNGGFGAVHAALRRGLPLVVAGRTEDKAEVNARVAWSGAGVDLRTSTPDPRRIREAVLQVLDARDSHRRAAARLAAALAATDAIGSLLGIADELVEAGARAAGQRPDRAGGGPRAERG